MGRGPTLCLSLETSVKLPEYTCICGCHPSPLNSPSEGVASGGTEAAKNWGPASVREGRFSRAIRALPLVRPCKKCKTWKLHPQLLSRCYALCMQTLLVWNVPPVAEGGAVWSFLPTRKLPPVLAVLAPCEVTSLNSVNNCVSREQ